MPKRPPDHVTVPLDTSRGMWKGGDVANAPKGFCASARNMYPKAGRWKLRPQFTYDDLSNIRGLTVWEDDTNKVTRGVAIDSSGNLKAKGTSGETWGSAATGTVGGTRLTSATNYRGVLYGMQDDGAGVPSAAFSYNGTAIDTSPFTSGIYSRAIVAWKERLFLLYPRVSFKNMLGFTVTVGPPSTFTSTPKWSNAYAMAALSGTGGAVNCVIEDVTANGVTTTRLVTQSLAANAVSLETAGDVSGEAVFPASDVAQAGVFTPEFRVVNATADVPLTIEIHVDAPAATRNTAISVGHTTTESAGGTPYIFECVTAGTTAGAAPAWTSTVGNTTTDGTAVLRNMGVLLVRSQEATLLADGQWRRVPVPFDVPKGRQVHVDAGWAVYAKLKFYNSRQTALTEHVTIEVAYKDGLADGAVGKANHGWQMTLGDFRYPFGNYESAVADTLAIVDMPEVVWSEIGEPTKIRAANTFNMRGIAGYPAALSVVGGKLVAAKRRSVTTFGATESPDIPILPEGDERTGFGALNPKACDVFEDYWYSIGEDEIVRWRPGMDSPIPLCGDAMREEMFNKSTSTWVESQTTPANRALCCIDQKNRLLLAYVQKGKIHVKSLDSAPGSGWSYFDVGDGKQICDMVYNPTTGNVYVAFTTADAGTAGLARLDPTQATAQDSISTSGTTAVAWEIISRTLELGSDITVEMARIFDNITDSQSGQTYTVSVSQDGGNTFDTSNQVEIDPEATGSQYRPHEVALFQTGGQLQIKFAHSGKGGEANGDVSRIELDVQSQGRRYQKDNVIAGSATL